MRRNYTIGVENYGEYELVLNSDESRFGGWGNDVRYHFDARVQEANGFPYAIDVDIPGLSVLYIELKKKKRLPSAKKKESSTKKPAAKKAPAKKSK